MGQKVNPIGLRLNITRTWDSIWYADKEYSTYLIEDQKIRKYLKKRLYHAGLSKVKIERTGEKIRVKLFTARPGIVIGRRGSEADRLRAGRDEIAAFLASEGALPLGPSEARVDPEVALATVVAADVPVVPGSDGAVESEEDALSEARRIGFPVIIKAAAGGGGKGMRVAESAAVIENTFTMARNEAAAAFNDARVYIERSRFDDGIAALRAQMDQIVIGHQLVLQLVAEDLLHFGVFARLRACDQCRQYGAERDRHDDETSERGRAADAQAREDEPWGGGGGGERKSTSFT